MKTKLLIVVLLLSVSAFGASGLGLQTGETGIVLNAATETGRGTCFALTRHAGQVNAFTFWVETTGEPTAYTVNLEGAQTFDGSDAVTIGTITQATSQTVYVSNVFPKHVCANLAALSGGTSPKITAKVIPLVTSSALPTAGEDGACLVTASGGWARGACSGDPITNITGNAATATALAANGANCSAGQAPLGVDASGAVEGCFTPSGALPSGVASDGLEGLAVTGKVAAASVETTGSAAYVQIPDGGTAGANKLTSAATAKLYWGLLPVAQTIASGTATLGTDSIAAGQCATAVTVSASGVATTDVISWTPNADISGVTGYTPSGTLRIYPYPTANNVSFKVCNGSASDAVTPGAVTLNFKVVR